MTRIRKCQWTRVIRAIIVGMNSQAHHLGNCSLFSFRDFMWDLQLRFLFSGCSTLRLDLKLHKLDDQNQEAQVDMRYERTHRYSE